MVSIRVKTLSKTRLVASRYIKREKVSLPVDLLPVVAQKRLCLNFLWFWTKILTSLIFRYATDPPKFCTFWLWHSHVCLMLDVVSNRLFRSGNFCPVCLKVYRNDESDLPMVCCDMCDRWVHTGKGVFTLQTFLLLRYTLRFTEWKIHKNIQISLCYILRSK